MINKKEITLDYYIRTTWQNLFKMYNHIAAKYGLTQATGLVLLILHYDKPTLSGELAEAMGWEPTSLSRLLNSMEKKGLICRKNDPNDKRKVGIYLTDLGKEKKVIAKKVVKTLDDLIKAKLSPEEIDTFISVFHKINDEIENYKAEKSI